MQWRSAPHLETDLQSQLAELLRSDAHRGSLPSRCFQMESHCTSPLFRNLQNRAGEHSTVIRRSSTSSDQPEQKPACRSPLDSTVATIPPVPNRHPHSFKPID